MRKLLANVQFALKGVTKNKVRSFLTLLGILIGIGSVIALQAVGDGAQDQIIGDLESLGTDVITVNQMMPNFSAFDDHAANPGPPSQEEMEEMQPPAGLGGNNVAPLTLDDYNAILDSDLEGIRYISPTIVLDVDVMSMEDESYSTVSITAVDDEYFNIYGLQANEGSLFADISEEDELVAVLGSEMTEVDYYDPEEKVLYMEDEEVKVIGVLAEHEATLFEEDTNTQIFIPYNQRQRLGFESEDVTLIVVKAESNDVVTGLAEDIEALLMENRDEDLETITFSVFTVEQLTERISVVTDTFTLLLSAIAAISLLVGGIGIGNVMLISVTERTREIGIRKAIGARNSDILVQFLLEAIFLSLIGGGLGIASGYGLAYLVQRWINVEPVFSINNILFATVISVIVGVVCGFLPALRASRLNPIDALRYE